MESKRITITGLERKVFIDLLEASLKGYYSQCNIDEMELEERMEALMERTIIEGFLKKIR